MFEADRPRLCVSIPVRYANSCADVVLARTPAGHRTFPTNVFFAGNGPGVAKLRNVLVAYSRRNPKIGCAFKANNSFPSPLLTMSARVDCQGMNNLVATLLLTHPTEEDAFWVLVCIIEVRPTSAVPVFPASLSLTHLLSAEYSPFGLLHLAPARLTCRPAGAAGPRRPHHAQGCSAPRGARR